MKKLLSKITAASLAATLAFPTGTELLGINFGTSVVASAAAVTSGTCGTNLIWSLDDTGTLTISYTGSGSGEGIPDWTYSNKAPWIQYKDDIKSVVIKDGVTSIGNDAFRDCSGITVFTIPNTVTTIGDYAFWGCSGITSITIPDSVTSIGSSPFNYCSNLQSITVDDRNTAYCSVDGVLFNKAKTTLISYPGKNSSVNYVIPNTVTTINIHAFSGSNIKSVTIPSSVSEMKNNVFSDCASLESVVFEESSQRYSIPDTAFRGCTSLKNITIPGNITGIFNYAFEGCSSLESVTISEGVNDIGEGAFSGCSSLKTVSIPKSVNNMSENYVFSGCTSLESIDVAEGSYYFSSIDGVLFNSAKSKLIIYPANKSGTSYAIPNSVTTIASNAFGGNNNLASITIPNGVETIGAWAFASSKSLTSVSIPESVTAIDVCAFSSCEKLTEISVDANNSKYLSENGVLFDKDKKVLYTYPAGKSGNSYTVPNTVKQIFAYAFGDCVNLENITLNEGLVTIFPAAFIQCTSLKSIKIPSTVTALGAQAFAGCTSLTEIPVDDNNSKYTSVDGVLFDKNKTTLIVYPCGKSDTSYSVPNGVNSVYNQAFMMCPNPESIAFPPSVTSFGYGLIFGCEKLASVFVPESAAFNYQIDPETMFTSEVRYTVSGDEAEITKIELGTEQTKVDIPETICGYTVASVIPSQWAKVGKHTHKWDANDNCALCGVDRAIVFDITITEPVAGEALAAQATVNCNAVEENCDITWEPASADGKAGYGTAYTASVTIRSGSTPVVTVNGEAVDSSNIIANTDGSYTVKYTFDATDMRTLTASDFSFSAPTDLAYNGSAKKAAVTTAVSGAGDITVKYYDENGDELSSAPVNAGTYTVKIDVAEGAEYAAANELTDNTWTFTITRAAVTVTAKDYTVKLGNTLPANLEYETAGLKGNDTLASIGANVTIGYENDVTPSAIGNYTIVVSGAANTTDYTLTYINGKLTITAKKVQTITADDVTITYGETGKKITATNNGDGAITYAVKTGEDVIDVAADGTITALKAGTATVEITAAETFDYAKATTTVTVTVNKAAVTIKADDKTVYQNAALPAFTYSVTGLANGDTLSFTPVLTCEATTTSTVGTYAITVAIEITEDECYTYTTQNGTLTVKKKSSGGGYRPTTPTEPNNPSIGGSSKSWSDVAADLGKLTNGSEATIELNGNATIPVEVIKAIADKDSKVTFVINSVFSWVIDGAEITTPVAIDLTLIKTASTKSDSLRGIEGTQFKINGTNIPTDLVIAFKKEHKGKFANLYKSVDGKLVFVTCAKLGADGKVSLSDVTEKGDYVAMLCELSDRPGDMDNDGIMNAKDALSVLKDSVGLEKGKNPLVSDMNNDGFINAKDALAILRKIVGLA